MVENGAQHLDAPRVLKAALLSARAMEVEKGVLFKVVGSVQRVCMEEQTFV